MSLRSKLRRYRAWIAVAILLVVAGVAYWIYSSPQEEEVTTVYETEAAAISTISSTVSGTGNVDVHDTTDVYPAVNGTVASVEVAEGTIVKAGATLFTLDASEAEANSAKTWSSVEQAKQGVAKADQSVASAESQLLKAENALESLEVRSQAPTSTVTDGEIEQAEKEIDAAEAQVTAAYAEQDSAEASLYSANVTHDNAKADEAEYRVTAPVDGVVWSLGIEEGDAVSTSSGGGGTSTAGTTESTSDGAPVVLAPTEPLAVKLAINEVDAPALALDQRAEIEFDALPALVITGRVTEIAAEATIEQGVVTYDVWLTLDVSDESLMQGMSAAATIVTEVAQDQLVVPNASVQTDDEDQTFVEVLEEPDGEPRSVYVSTGITSASYTVVTDGLGEGELVVTQTTTQGGEEDEAAEGGGGFPMPGMGGGRP